MRIAFLLPLTILTQRSQARNIFNYAVKSLSYARLLTSRAERQISELDVPAVYILLWFFPTSNKQTNNNKNTKYIVLERHNRSSSH